MRPLRCSAGTSVQSLSRLTTGGRTSCGSGGSGAYRPYRSNLWELNDGMHVSEDVRMVPSLGSEEVVVCRSSQDCFGAQVEILPAILLVALSRANRTVASGFCRNPVASGFVETHAVSADQVVADRSIAMLRRFGNVWRVTPSVTCARPTHGQPNPSTESTCSSCLRCPAEPETSLPIFAHVAVHVGILAALPC